MKADSISDWHVISTRSMNRVDSYGSSVLRQRNKCRVHLVRSDSILQDLLMASCEVVATRLQLPRTNAARTGKRFRTEADCPPKPSTTALCHELQTNFSASLDLHFPSSDTLILSTLIFIHEFS